MAMNSIAMPVMSSPMVTPMIASGTIMKMITGWRTALNSTITTSTMPMTPSGTTPISESIASVLVPSCPSHSKS